MAVLGLLWAKVQHALMPIFAVTLYDESFPQGARHKYLPINNSHPPLHFLSRVCGSLQIYFAIAQYMSKKLL